MDPFLKAPLSIKFVVVRQLLQLLYTRRGTRSCLFRTGRLRIQVLSRLVPDQGTRNVGNYSHPPA